MSGPASLILSFQHWAGRRHQNNPDPRAAACCSGYASWRYQESLWAREEVLSLGNTYTVCTCWKLVYCNLTGIYTQTHTHVHTHTHHSYIHTRLCTLRCLPDRNKPGRMFQPESCCTGNSQNSFLCHSRDEIDLLARYPFKSC